MATKTLIFLYIENRPNLPAMLRHEELQSKETATVVMSKIMAAGGPDIKVNTHVMYIVKP